MSVIEPTPEYHSQILLSSVLAYALKIGGKQIEVSNVPVMVENIASHLIDPFSCEAMFVSGIITDTHVDNLKIKAK